MATTLQRQLAAINAKSTNQLNLKAQKARHGQSLLFESREAATQSFETIYQICLDGFNELCQLDRRFSTFAGNLFAEGSVAVEREHMTAKENQELDKVIEQFFGLVSGRLLLRPAHKAVEWLIRRWKAHEQNPTPLVFAFLPYHDHESFATVLSLLSKDLPPTLSFLRPYIASLSTPPRHVLASAAVNNSAFLSQYTSFVLNAAGRGHQSSVVLGLWASTVARAVNAMLDSAQSGREEVRRQKMEDVMTKVLPILQDTLAVASSQELFLAACIIITLLASRGQLVDSAIDALMESVTSAWSEGTRNEAVECLILLAEEKEEPKLPRRVANALINTGDALEVLLALQSRFEAERLVSGLLNRAIQNVKVKKDDASMAALDLILIRGAVTYKTLAQTRKALNELAEEGDLPADVASSLLLASGSPQQDTDGDIELTAVVTLDGVDNDEDTPPQIDQLPTLPSNLVSFLDADAVSRIDVEPYFSWFQGRSKQDKKTLALELATIMSRTHRDDHQIRFMTFLAAFWCDNKRSVAARVAALELASEQFAKSALGAMSDYQPLYPSILLGLCDPALSVRRAAVQAVLHQHGKTDSKCVLWCENLVYGAKEASPVWLPHQEYRTFFEQVIGEQVEDSILSSAATIDAIVGWLNSDEGSRIAESLASLAFADGRPSIADLLFGIIRDVRSNAGAARQRVIVPSLDKYLNGRQAQQDAHLVQAALRCLTHRTTDEINLLKRLAQDGTEEISIAAFKQISSISRLLKPDTMAQLLGWFIEQATSPANSSGTASETLRDMDIPLDALSHQLTLVLNKPSTTEIVRPWKKARLEHATKDKMVNTDQTTLQTRVKIATLCLELIEDSTNATKKTRGASNESTAPLLKCLFSLLAEIQAWQSSTGSNFAYLQSLTLACMITILTQAQSQGQQIDVSIMRTDLIVDTLRSTANPQVHNNALLLISKIAAIAPETILHSVMPLFTFMSSATLRQADAYSAHVISMTIESIVPPLVASLKKRRRELVVGASDLLLSFVAAYEHIPSPRRVGTFVQLLKTLGADETLHAITAMLVERYQGDVTLGSTLHSIMSSFSVETQMTALSKYLELVTDACQKRRNVADSILGFQEKNAAEAHASVRVLLDGFAGLTHDAKLRKRIAGQFRSQDTAKQIQTSYGAILQALISLPNAEDGAINFSEPGLKSAYGNALEALLRLLPLSDFIESSSALMQGGTEMMRAKVFASLTARANDAQPGDSRIASVFLEALPNCAAFLTSSQPVNVRQAALLCIDAICEKFGRLDREAVAAVVGTITGEAALASDASTLQTASMLCMASAVEVLGESFVSLSANSLQLALDHIQSGLAAATVDDSLVDAGFSFLNALLDHQAWLLSNGADLQRAVVLACTAAQQSHSSEPVEEFNKLAPKQMKLAIMNSALLDAYDKVFATGSGAVLQLISIEHTLIDIHTKKDILKHAQGFLDFMLRAMDLRQSWTVSTNGARMSEDSARELDLACTATTQAMMALTLKLNDVTLRPFFVLLSEWSRSDSHRALALFDYTTVLFEQLGSIVTSYASFVLDDCATILKDARDASGNRGLLTKVLLSLSASFRHDQDDFWTATTHFGAIEMPLLDLLHMHDQSQRASEVIVDLASAVSSSPELLKTMNAHLMELMRNDESAVRLAAVKTQRAVTEKLTFDWLNMLPEMLPFISELLEDDDETVEREALRWVSQLEEVTGESLEGMLA